MHRADTDASKLGPLDPDAGGRERIHASGAIQPHGCLISCSLSGWAITAVSANASAYFGRDPTALLGAQLEDVLPPKVLHDLRNVLQSAMVSGSVDRLLDVRTDESESRYDLTLHAAGANAVSEMVPRAGADVTTDPVILVKSMMARLRRAPNLDRFLHLAAGQVRAFSGFDRVMIYKFLEDHSGEVVAEARRSDMPPVLGLRCPASDVPAEARALHRRQWLRLIPDTVHTSVPLLTQADRAGEVDLGLASLRSVSPVLLEHLRSMGTRATLTVSLVAGHELWGLVSCHHESPRRVGSSTSAIAELFGQILSLEIDAKEQSKQLEVAREREAVHERPTVLIAELDHRAESILALIRSLLRQRRQGAESVDDLANEFERRVLAMDLAQAQPRSREDDL